MEMNVEGNKNFNYVTDPTKGYLEVSSSTYIPVRSGRVKPISIYC